METLVSVLRYFIVSYFWQASPFKNQKRCCPCWKLTSVTFYERLKKPKSNDTILRAMAIVLPNLRSLKHEKESERKIVTRTPSSRISSPNFHNRLHLATRHWNSKKCLWKIDSNRALLNMQKNLMRSSRFLSQNKSGNDSQIKRSKKSFSYFEEVAFIFGKSMSTETSVSRKHTFPSPVPYFTGKRCSRICFWPNLYSKKWSAARERAI